MCVILGVLTRFGAYCKGLYHMARGNALKTHQAQTAMVAIGAVVAGPLIVATAREPKEKFSSTEDEKSQLQNKSAKEPKPDQPSTEGEKNEKSQPQNKK